MLIIGTVIFGGGIAMYYGLQAIGISPGIAGNYVQLFVVLGLCIGWIGSYIFRVANKVRLSTACIIGQKHLGSFPARSSFSDS